MSIRVMSTVWEKSKASGTDLIVLLYIANTANDEGEAWPGIKRIAKHARVTERSVQYSLKRLVDLGELDIEHQSSKLGTNIFRVTLGGEAGFTGGGEASFTRGVNPTAPNTSVETSITNTKASAPEFEEWFNYLWSIYPHFGQRSSKQESYRLFVSLNPNPALCSQISQAIEYGKESQDWKNKGGQFVPGMQVWLRKKTWESLPLDTLKQKQKGGLSDPKVSNSGARRDWVG